MRLAFAVCLLAAAVFANDLTSSDDEAEAKLKISAPRLNTGIKSLLRKKDEQLKDIHTNCNHKGHDEIQKTTLLYSEKTPTSSFSDGETTKTKIGKHTKKISNVIDELKSKTDDLQEIDTRQIDANITPHKEVIIELSFPSSLRGLQRLEQDKIKKTQNNMKALKNKLFGKKIMLHATETENEEEKEDYKKVLHTSEELKQNAGSEEDNIEDESVTSKGLVPAWKLEIEDSESPKGDTVTESQTPNSNSDDNLENIKVNNRKQTLKSLRRKLLSSKNKMSFELGNKGNVEVKQVNPQNFNWDKLAKIEQLDDVVEDNLIHEVDTEKEDAMPSANTIEINIDLPKLQHSVKTIKPTAENHDDKTSLLQKNRTKHLSSLKEEIDLENESNKVVKEIQNSHEEKSIRLPDAEGTIELENQWNTKKEHLQITKEKSKSKKGRIFPSKGNVGIEINIPNFKRSIKNSKSKTKQNNTNKEAKPIEGYTSTEVYEDSLDENELNEDSTTSSIGKKDLSFPSGRTFEVDISIPDLKPLVEIGKSEETVQSVEMSALKDSQNKDTQKVEIELDIGQEQVESPKSKLRTENKTRFRSKLDLEIAFPNFKGSVGNGKIKSKWNDRNLKGIPLKRKQQEKDDDLDLTTRLDDTAISRELNMKWMDKMESLTKLTDNIRVDTLIKEKFTDDNIIEIDLEDSISSTEENPSFPEKAIEIDIEIPYLSPSVKHDGNKPQSNMPIKYTPTTDEKEDLKSENRKLYLKRRKNLSPLNKIDIAMPKIKCSNKFSNTKTRGNGQDLKALKTSWGEKENNLELKSNLDHNLNEDDDQDECTNKKDLSEQLTENSISLNALKEKLNNKHTFELDENESVRARKEIPLSLGNLVEIKVPSIKQSEEVYVNEVQKHELSKEVPKSGEEEDVKVLTEKKKVSKNTVRSKNNIELAIPKFKWSIGSGKLSTKGNNLNLKPLQRKLPGDIDQGYSEFESIPDDGLNFEDLKEERTDKKSCHEQFTNNLDSVLKKSATDDNAIDVDFEENLKTKNNAPLTTENVIEVDIEIPSFKSFVETAENEAGKFVGREELVTMDENKDVQALIGKLKVQKEKSVPSGNRIEIEIPKFKWSNRPGHLKTKRRNQNLEASNRKRPEEEGNLETTVSLDDDISLKDLKEEIRMEDDFLRNLIDNNDLDAFKDKIPDNKDNEAEIDESKESTDVWSKELPNVSENLHGKRKENLKKKTIRSKSTIDINIPKLKWSVGSGDSKAKRNNQHSKASNKENIQKEYNFEPSFKLDNLKDRWERKKDYLKQLTDEIDLDILAEKHNDDDSIELDLKESLSAKGEIPSSSENVIEIDIDIPSLKVDENKHRNGKWRTKEPKLDMKGDPKIVKEKIQVNNKESLIPSANNIEIEVPRIKWASGILKTKRNNRNLKVLNKKGPGEKNTSEQSLDLESTYTFTCISCIFNIHREETPSFKVLNKKGPGEKYTSEQSLDLESDLHFGDLLNEWTNEIDFLKELSDKIDLDVLTEIINHDDPPEVDLKKSLSTKNDIPTSSERSIEIDIELPKLGQPVKLYDERVYNDQKKEDIAKLGDKPGLLDSNLLGMKDKGVSGRKKIEIEIPKFKWSVGSGPLKTKRNNHKSSLSKDTSLENDNSSELTWPLDDNVNFENHNDELKINKQESLRKETDYLDNPKERFTDDSTFKADTKESSNNVKEISVPPMIEVDLKIPSLKSSLRKFEIKPHEDKLRQKKRPKSLKRKWLKKIGDVEVELNRDEKLILKKLQDKLRSRKSGFEPSLDTKNENEQIEDYDVSKEDQIPSINTSDVKNNEDIPHPVGQAEVQVNIPNIVKSIDSKQVKAKQTRKDLNVWKEKLFRKKQKLEKKFDLKNEESLEDLTEKWVSKSNDLDFSTKSEDLGMLKSKWVDLKGGKDEEDSFIARKDIKLPSEINIELTVPSFENSPRDQHKQDGVETEDEAGPNTKIGKKSKLLKLKEIVVKKVSEGKRVLEKDLAQLKEKIEEHQLKLD